MAAKHRGYESIQEGVKQRTLGAIVNPSSISMTHLFHIFHESVKKCGKER